MRRLLWPVVNGLASMIVVAGAVSLVAGQSIPPGQPFTCEQNLEQSRAENIALRKQLAQTMFQAAALEEQGIALKKQVDAQNASGKAAEKK